MTTQHYLPPAPLNTPTGSLAWAEWYRLLRQTAESGQTAYITINDPTTGLQSKLNSDAADTLNGTISFGTLGAFKVGTVTWNGTSATGTGVMFTQNGIVGASSGSVKFVIKSDGTATFGGALTAATGTFAGDVYTSAGMYAAGYANASITIDGTTYDPSVYGESSSSQTGYATGLLGYGHHAGGCTGITGVAKVALNSSMILSAAVLRGESTNTNGLVYGLDATSKGGTDNIALSAVATNNSSGAGKSVQGALVSSSTTNSNTPNVGASITQTGGASATSSALELYSSTGVALKILSGGIRINDTSLVGTGAATATFPGNNKPGSNSTNTWLQININGIDYYIPVWT